MVSGSGTFDTKNAGVAKVVTSSDLALSGADAANYALSAATATTTADITKANATITVTAYHVTFDGSPHTATGSASGVDSEDLSTLLHLTGTTQTNAGDYLAAPWTFDGDVNYTASSGTVHNRIDQAAATVTAGSGTKVYGITPDPALSATTASGFLGGDAAGIALNSTRAAGELVASYVRR